MKKILIINTVPMEMGGISSVIVNYYKQIDKEKFQMDVVVKDSIVLQYKQLFQENHSRIYVLKRNRNPVKYMVLLYKIIKQEKYDIVHVHGNSATMAIDLFSALLAGCPVRIAHCHNTKCSHGLVHGILNPIFKRCYTKALACSDQAGSWIYGKDQFDILPNGIYISEYRFSKEIRAEVRQELKLENKFVLGHVGFMNEQKNHQKLFEILECIKSKKENVHLLCVTGSTGLPEHLQIIIKEKHLEQNITVLFKRNDVNRLMQAMDVFVFPSLWEGLGIVLLEAQASGLPCVASNQVPEESNISGAIEFVDLDLDVHIWKDIIHKMYSNCEDRSKNYDLMYQSVFNIENSCRMLEHYYELSC